MTSLKALPLVFLASAVTLGAEPIRLRVGAATTEGMVRFTLSAAPPASQGASGGPVLAETPETATFEVPVAPGTVGDRQGEPHPHRSGRRALGALERDRLRARP